MYSDPPDPENERLRFYITDIELQPSITDPNCKLSTNLFVDEQLVYTFPWVDNTQPSRWSRLLLCEASPDSSIVLRLSRSLKDKQRSFIFPSYQFSELNEGNGEVTLERPDILWLSTIKYLTQSMAERIFLDELGKVQSIEGIYDTLKPDETVKFLFEIALKFAGIAAEALHENTAKLSFLILMKTWELLNQQTRLDDTVRGILRGLLRIQDILEVLSQASSSMLTTAMDRSREPISDILTLLEDVSVYIFNRLTADDRGDAYDVEAYLARLENLQKSFHDSWSPATISCVDPVDTVEEQPALEWQYVQTSVDEPTSKPQDPYKILKPLQPVSPSGYDPSQACMDGTRKAVLNRIVTWAQNRDSSQKFMWISGQVGMGKTAIATSLCRQLDRSGTLGGSFFCQHDNPNRNHPLLLVNGLVYELASRCPPYAHEVANAIRANRTICTTYLDVRFEGLIEAPLRRLKSLPMSKVLVVIVDALDECGNRDSRNRVLQKLYDLSQLVPWLKVIFTARPEGDLQDSFHSYFTHSPIVHLQTYDAADDIRVYIHKHLDDLARMDRWPDGYINQLSTAAQGMFLWAALATKYIKESPVSSLARLWKVLGNQKSSVTDYLDSSYTRALWVAMNDNEDETREAYTKCIEIILSITEHEFLTIPHLKFLMLMAGRIEVVATERIIRNLGTLISITSDQHFRFHHPSFKHYLTNYPRSQGPLLQLEQYQLDLADCCFTVMREELRFNICELPTSYLLNHEVPDLKVRIDSHVGPALQYACTWWIDHFVESPSQSLVKKIREFLEGPQLMYWIEVLSLLGRVNVAISGLYKLTVMRNTGLENWNQIDFWAKDALHFVLSFYDAIIASSPHLYLSALALSSTRSLTSRRMCPYFPNTIAVAQGGNSNWHPCVSIVNHPQAVESLCYSLDGSKAAFGYPGGSLCIWDTKTGTRISGLLDGHTGSVICVIFSPTGNLLASGSKDSTIRLWDGHDYKVASCKLVGHSDSVHSISFSPNANVVASGSSDKTIRLWDLKSMRPIGGPYSGHSSRVSSVVFSPDGTKLLSGSWDKTIRVWTVDPGSQELVGIPHVILGHTDLVTCAVFSPEGSKIASGSADGTISMWDAQTGSNIQYPSSPKHCDGITSISFSPDGRVIASSSIDGMIKLWGATQMTVLHRPFGHFDRVNGVIFSPDGHYIMSGSTDKTTRMWEISMPNKLVAASPLVGHSSVNCIAVSSDGTRIASGSDDRTIRMWDAETGAPIGSPLTGHSNQVGDLSISPDGAHIVSCAIDSTLKLWDTTTSAVTKSYQHRQNIYCTKFSPDGATIAFGTQDSRVYLWDPNTWKMIGSALTGHTTYVLALAFSSDGAFIASGSGDCNVIIWDTRTHSHSGEPLSGHKGAVRSIAFSPCGTRLVSGSSDQKIRIWDLIAGHTIHELSGHSSVVRAVAFSPSGLHVVSGSEDNTVRLWSAETGETIGKPYNGHTSHVKCVAFLPCGEHFISGSNDATIRAWRLDQSQPAVDQASNPENTFCWPENPCELSSHPDKHGWVTHDQRSRSFWLPLCYHQPQSSNVDSNPTGQQLFLDYSKFVHGTNWTSVACDSIQRSRSSE